MHIYIDKLSESLKFFCWNYNFLIKIYTPHKKKHRLNKFYNG